MPLFENDRIHLFLILLLVLIQFFVWNSIITSKSTDPGVKSGGSLLRSLNPSPAIVQIKHFAVKILRRISGSLRSLKPEAQTSSYVRPKLHKILELEERNAVFYGASQVVRAKRSSLVNFPIGRLVWHRRLGFKAVVVGWDEKAKAPPIWMSLHYPRLDVEMSARSQVNYRILPDSKDTRYQFGPLYIPQSDLEFYQATETEQDAMNEKLIKHSLLTEYFDHFDGEKYTPRPWLRRIYPQG